MSQDSVYTAGTWVLHKQLGLGVVTEPSSVKACWCYFVGANTRVKVLCEVLPLIPDVGALGRLLIPKLNAYASATGDIVDRWDAFQMHTTNHQQVATEKFLEQP